MIAINSDVSSLAYIFHTRVTLSFCETQTVSPFLQSSCSLFIPVANLYAHRDRESRPPEPEALHRDTCSSVQAIRFLGSVFRDCSLLGIGDRGIKRSATYSSWWTLMIGYFVFFSVDVRGTALRTSFCIDCGPLLHAMHYVN